jgi:hypothetical protein
MRLIPPTCVIFLILSSTALADELRQSTANPQGQNLDLFNPQSDLQLWLCVLCVFFGSIIFIGQTLLLSKTGNFTSDDVAKSATIILVIVGSLLLIISGYDSQQTAQAFGLFGTIVGYLLGRSAGKKE